MDARSPRLLVVAIASFVLIGSAVAQPAVAATFTANSTADEHDLQPGDGLCYTPSGNCTLRAAIEESNALGGTNTIDLLAGDVYTINTLTGPYVCGILGCDSSPVTSDYPGLTVTSNVTITVPNGRASIQGMTLPSCVASLQPFIFLCDADWGVMRIAGGVTVNLGNVDISNGTIGGVSPPFPDGGAISNAGALTLTNSAIRGNSAISGGGISNVGTVSLKSGSVVTGNSASSGGGIANSGLLAMAGATISGNTGGGITNDGTLSVSDSSVSGNSGAGVANGGTLTLSGSTISGNSAFDGAGITNTGTMTLTNATISGNKAARNGGGIWNASGSASGSNLTIADNVADSDGDGSGDGGGIFNVSGGTVSLVDTIVADNVDGSASTKYPDCLGSLNSRGYDLIMNTTGCTIGGDTTGSILGRDPQLGPLQNNGGPTQTQALLIKTAKSCTPPFGCFTYQVPSPAIDAGSPGGSTACAGTDQRGVARPVDGNGDGIARCDIGALEWTPLQLPFPLGTWALSPAEAVVHAGERVGYTFRWTMPAGRGWRSLDTLQLRFFDGENTALWLRFQEVPGAPGVFMLVDPSNGNVGPAFAPGSPNRLESDDATVYLSDTSVAGPPGRTVTLTVPISFKPHAAGHVYDVLVLATDDTGQLQGFHRAGSVVVGPLP